MPDTTVSIAVSLSQPALAVGATTQAVARITTDVPDAGLDAQSVVWSSSAPAVATVSPAGLVRAVAAGTAVIRAAIGAVAGTATVTVAVPVVTIDAVAEAILKLVPVGGMAQIKGPTLVFDVQRSA